MDDPDVVAAARFIRENAAKPISVDDVIGAGVDEPPQPGAAIAVANWAAVCSTRFGVCTSARAMNLLRNDLIWISQPWARESGFTRRGPVQHRVPRVSPECQADAIPT
jgi:hypothetical protein